MVHYSVVAVQTLQLVIHYTQIAADNMKLSLQTVQAADELHTLQLSEHFSHFLLTRAYPAAHLSQSSFPAVHDTQLALSVHSKHSPLALNIFYPALASTQVLHPVLSHYPALHKVPLQIHPVSSPLSWASLLSAHPLHLSEQAAHFFYAASQY